jgi:hypothetical protein
VSRIYQPQPGQNFEYVDGLENLFTRQNLSFSTSSTSLVPVRTVDLVPNLFDVDGKKLELEAEGNLDSVGISDGIGFGVNFDGAPVVAISLAGVRDGGSVLPKVRLYRRGTNLILYLYSESEPTQSTQNNAQLHGNWVAIPNVDFSIARTLTLTARVLTATSVLTLGILSGSFR